MLSLTDGYEFMSVSRDNAEAEMRLSLMAMAADRLGRANQPAIKMRLVYTIRVGDGGSTNPESSGVVLRIPSIAALEPLWKN